jgi:hypothetical protein
LNSFEARDRVRRAHLHLGSELRGRRRIKKGDIAYEVLVSGEIGRGVGECVGSGEDETLWTIKADRAQVSSHRILNIRFDIVSKVVNCCKEVRNTSEIG